MTHDLLRKVTIKSLNRNNSLSSHSEPRHSISVLFYILNLIGSLFVKFLRGIFSFIISVTKLSNSQLVPNPILIVK